MNCVSITYEEDKPYGMKISDTFQTNTKKNNQETTDWDIYDPNPYARDVAESIENYKKVLEMHNNILIRIVGVTDDVLREQLQEEYGQYHERLELAGIAVKVNYIKYIKVLSLDWLEELRAMYLTGTKLVDLTEALQSNGIDIVAVCSRMRFRLINSINQRRELTMFLNNLDLQINIVDLESISIDHIGIGKTIIQLRRPYFSRLGETSIDKFVI
jgi:hypothetical protein